MSYWDVLAEANALLERGELRAAEAGYHEARGLRKRSPGRVFWSETVGDAARRLWRGVSGREAPADDTRWRQETQDFRRRFRTSARRLLERARAGLADPAGLPAATRHDLCRRAVQLAVRSRLADLGDVDPHPFAAGALDAALALPDPPSADVVPEEAPLDAEARLDLVRRGVHLLSRFEASTGGTRERCEALAGALLSLLAPDSFTQPSDEAERRWQAARLTDRHLGRPAEAAALYGEYLEHPFAATERVEEARLRAAEILGNVDGVHLPVPRYDEARLRLETPMSTRDRETRRLGALDILDRRRPEPGEAWASVAPAGDVWHVILWESGRPCDHFTWRVEEDPDPLQRSLGACRGRIVWRDAECNVLLGSELDGFVHVFLEAEIFPSDDPDAGLDEPADEAIDWNEPEWPSHPALEPDRVAPGSGVDRALGCGRLWRRVLTRVEASDPALRDGIRDLARRGDGPSRFLADFLSLDPAAEAGWTVTHLADRANPRYPRRVEAATPPLALDAALFESPSLVVSTGRPGDILASWGETRARWRLVLDAADRLDDLAGCLARRGGRHTLIPPGAEVHDRAAALRRLAELAGGDDDGPVALLPLFHWTRITETHNGDLLDVLRLRPRPEGAVSLYDAYRELVSSLPRLALESDPAGWGGEYVERAEGSEVVAGLAEDLVRPDERLRPAWGVAPTAPSAWVFCDSPAVHWQLLRAHRAEPAALHGALARLGASHLSLILGGGFLRRDLERQFESWLAPFGRAASLALTDQRYPHLRLAGEGVAPDASVEVGVAAAGLMRRLGELNAGGRRVHLLPGRDGPLSRFLAALQRGEIASGFGRDLVWEAPESFWRRADGRARLRDGCLFVARLESLDMPVPVDADVPPTRGWKRRDTGLVRQNRRRRARCALEIGALLSRGAAEVEIADPRWWRSFPLLVGAEPERLADADADVAPFPVPPREVVRLVGDGRAEIHDLSRPELPTPKTGRRWSPRRTKRDPDLDAATAWLDVQGWIDPERRGLPPGVLERPAAAADPDWDAGRRRLVVGDGRAAWIDALSRVVAARERGDLEAWLLVIAESPPPAAAALRDATLSPGACLARNDDVVETWHAVVWARPHELADPRLRRRLSAAPPREVWASDLRDWLPSARASGHAHTPVLRCLLHELRTSTTLHARNLPASWARYFSSLLDGAADGVYREVATDLASTDLDLPPVPVGRVEPPHAACPGCGVVATWSDWRAVCPECGVGLGRWLAPAARRGLDDALWRAKLEALAARDDLYREQPLCIWVGLEALPRLTAHLDALGRPWRRQRDRWMTTRDADTPDWHVCVHGDLIDPPPECHHALLEAPSNEADFQDFRRLAGGATSLWFHPLELSTGLTGLAAGGGDHGRSAHRRLLTSFAAPPGLDAAWRWRGWLPPRLVEILTGLPVTEVRKTQGVASWLGAVHDERSGAEAEPDAGDAAGPRLLCRDLSQMEVEYKLTRLHPLLDAILPVLFASLSDGAVGHVFLDDLPMEIDPVELSWLDRFLLGVSLHGQLEPGAGALLYAPLGGVINGPGRRLGHLGGLEDAIAQLKCQVDFLVGAFRTLFAPGEDGDAPGTVSLGEKTDLILDDVSLETGILLGLWHLRGPGAQGEMLAEAEPRRGAGADPVPDDAMTLLRALAQEEHRWRERLLEAWRTGFVADLPAPSAGAGADAPPVAPRAHAVVARELADAMDQGGPEFLVLRGVTGTGRLATVAQALALAARETLDVHDLRVYAPDAATAARFHLAWRTCARHLPAPRLNFGADLPAGSSLAGGGVPHRPGGEVAVLLEAHALRAADRFRLAQRFRMGVQIWTVEPVRSTEAWEHLFLAAPDPESVRVFGEQKRQSRRVAEETLDLAEQATGRRLRTRAGRQKRGEVSARLTASLDDGLAVMSEKQAEWGGLLWNAVAPVPADLDYLGRAAARQGWLPVYRWELDAMLLPGPFEFLAVADDLAAARNEAEDARPTPAAPSFLPAAAAAADYAAWLEAAAADPSPTTLGDLLDAVTRAGWSESFLGDAAARHRLHLLVADSADQEFEAFLARPLLEAWRRVVGRLPGHRPAGRGSPLLMLSTPEEAEGVAAGALAYFCLGTEDPRRHYDVASRAGDRLLVLYKTRSPLADDGE